MEDGSRKYREIECNTELGHALAAVYPENHRQNISIVVIEQQ